MYVKLSQLLPSMSDCLGTSTNPLFCMSYCRRGFGGKFGEEVMEKLDVKYMADLSTFGEVQLRSLFGEKSGLLIFYFSFKLKTPCFTAPSCWLYLSRSKWLYNVAHGLEYEAVAPRLLPKSVGCSKNFLGPKTLKTKGSVTHLFIKSIWLKFTSMHTIWFVLQVKHWLLMLSQELEERLIKDRDAVRVYVEFLDKSKQRQLGS